jgi:hypothetical protein
MQLKINNEIEKQQLINQIRMMLNSIEEYDINHSDTPVVSSVTNNINPKEATEVITECIVEVIDEKNMMPQTLSVKHQNHGGKRSGAGRKPGFKQTPEHIEKRASKMKESMKGNSNAVKNQ